MGSLKLNHLYEPKASEVGETLFQFLSHLGGPTVIHLSGKNSGPARVLVTLLHGNEPSGIKAVHSLLREGFTPIFDVKIIIASVVAARTEPVFNYRMLPGQEDLNRCFGRCEQDLQCQLALAISESIRQWKPEAVVDLHNTSGSGPAFCVSTHNTDKHLALGSHFSHRMIITDIQLGSLMEQTFTCPVVTAEAGGAQDDDADATALNGMKSYFNSENLFVLQQEIEVLSQPRRLELKTSSSIAYATSALADITLTMRQDIEKLNFGKTAKHEVLGWLNMEASDALQLDVEDFNVADFFTVESGQLISTRDLMLFMVTTRADIAKSDCLFYFVPV